MTPEQRKHRAKIAANSRWARPLAREEQSIALKAATERRFRKLVDPDGVLTDAQAAPLVEAAKRLHAAQLNMAKAKKQDAA